MSVALAFAASNAVAIGFGRPSTTATLGQPLNFTVALRQGPDEFIDAECVTADVLIGENKVAAQRLRYSVEGAANSQDRLLRITSSVIVDEPIITVTVQVGCPPTLSRAFTALADPPLLNLAQQSATAASVPLITSAPVVPAPVRIRPRPPTGQARAAGPPSSPSARAAGSAADPVVPREPRVAVAPASAPRARTPDVAAPVRRSEAAPVARLRLDPNAARKGQRTPAAAAAEPTAAASATTPAIGQIMAAAPAAPASAASATAAPTTAVATAASAAATAPGTPAVAVPTAAVVASAPLLSAEAERLRVLEESLTKLKADTASQAADIATLRARVQKAENERYANPVTYTLGLIAALLAGALGVMLFRRTRERDTSWFASAMAEDSMLPPAEAPPVPPSDSRFDADTLVTPKTQAFDAARSTLVLDDSRFAASPTVIATTAPETQPALTEQRREVSVEELIDLEQQAEFFVVLGQDDAAIDLLMSHLRNTGGISPLPYLKLLEIYHRIGDHEAYERMRDRFNRRFNAYAPEWGEDLAHGRSLEDYPEIMRQLEAMWPTPQRAMLELEAMLFRRDEVETFDVPAYGEVLFLYSMARDLSEHEVSMSTQPTVEMDNVDFLLPLDDDPNASGGSLYRPMISTIPMESNPDLEKPLTLDFDISAFGDMGEPFKKN